MANFNQVLETLTESKDVKILKRGLSYSLEVNGLTKGRSKDLDWIKTIAKELNLKNVKIINIKDSDKTELPFLSRSK
jgi:hypothetical protein